MAIKREKDRERDEKGGRQTDGEAEEKEITEAIRPFEKKSPENFELTLIGNMKIHATKLRRLKSLVFGLKS